MCRGEKELPFALNSNAFYWQWILGAINWLQLDGKPFPLLGKSHSPLSFPWSRFWQDLLQREMLVDSREAKDSSSRDYPHSISVELFMQRGVRKMWTNPGVCLVGTLTKNPIRFMLVAFSQVERECVCLEHCEQQGITTRWGWKSE